MTVTVNYELDDNEKGGTSNMDVEVSKSIQMVWVQLHLLDTVEVLH